MSNSLIKFAFFHYTSMLSVIAGGYLVKLQILLLMKSSKEITLRSCPGPS